MNEVVILIPIVNMPQNRTEEQLVLFMAGQVEKLIELGALKGTVDNIIKDYFYDEATNYINITVPSDVIGLTNELEVVGAATCPTYKVPDSMVEYIDAVDGEIKSFSAGTINERLRIALRNPKLRFRYTIMDYKRYYKQNESKLKKDTERATKLKNMFLTDVMGMFTEVLPLIEEGKQLATLVGVSQVTSKLNKVARELSIAYRRALKVEKSSGQLNKSIYSRLKKSYTEFMEALLDQVFPGMDEDQKTESKRYSRCADGRINLFSESTDAELEQEAEEEVLNEETRALNEDLKRFEEESQSEYSDGMQEVTFRTTNPEQLTKIVNAIGECGNGGHSFEIVIDPDSTKEEGGNIRFGWDGDGSDRVEISKYKTFSDKDKDWYVVGVLVTEDGEEEVYSAVQPQEEKPTKEEVLAFEPKAQDIKYLKVFANEESADAYRDGLAAKMPKTFSEPREKVSAEMLEKAKTDGVVQKKPNGSWGIISIDAGEWWIPDYESEEKAKNALEAYHANKFEE